MRNRFLKKLLNNEIDVSKDEEYLIEQYERKKELIMANLERTINEIEKSNLYKSKSYVKSIAASLILTTAIGFGSFVSPTAIYAAEQKVEEKTGYKKEGWEVPDVKSAKYLGSKQKDKISEIPGKETLLKGYKSKDGTYFNTLEYKGKIYGYQLDINGKAPMEYSLRDSNGDGKMDIKVIAQGKGETAQWLLNLYEKEKVAK